MQVKNTNELRFNKAAITELKKKFVKSSKLGIDPVFAMELKNKQTILNPNSSIKKANQISDSDSDSDLDDGKSTSTIARKISSRAPKFQLTQDHIMKLKNTRLMHKKDFRSFFGLLGSGANPFLSDRIFHLADQDHDQHVSFEEFATIIDIY